MKYRLVFILVVIFVVVLSMYSSGEENQGVVYPVLNDIMLNGVDNEIVLNNPVENRNKYLLKYEFQDTFTGEVFFETNWLEGGKQYRYNLGFVNRDVDCVAHIYSKDYKTYEDINQLNVYFKIGVKDYEQSI